MHRFNSYETWSQKEDITSLKFRRQFLLSSMKCQDLAVWKIYEFGNLFLYVHPECGLKIAKDTNSHIVLIGYFFDPERPDVSEEQLLQIFAGASSEMDISELLYPLVGRFVLLINDKDKTYIFNDACGLKTVYYTNIDDNFNAASQPNLLKLVTSLEPGLRYKNYVDSKYVRLNKEHYLPCGISLYDSVEQLMPNHYIEIGRQGQKRFWPNRKLPVRSVDEVVGTFSELLKKTMNTANSRFKLGLPLTAGLDSRLLLSACAEIKDDINCYTLLYRDLSKESPDVRIPSQITSQLGLKYDTIDCRNVENTEFLSIYEENSDMAHIDDWGRIAAGMYQKYDSNLVAVKGNCVEIGRCFYYGNCVHPKNITPEYLMELENLWKSFDFISAHLAKWHANLTTIQSKLGYNELDLFYWEHRIGSWQAQSQLEWDIVQEAFTPFNNRKLIDLMLSVPCKQRIEPDFLLFKNTIRKLWPETLNFPINPKSFFDKLRNSLKKLLKGMGIYIYIRKFRKIFW